ncbi:DUF6134 family protein [Chitinophaga ginsengisoli]|uniref:Uncharacterized protein n=1 Tax=Chitinophaga ginsengisoli TaxID=363837 RepID=A0A2P8GPQ1_9BACT|nr:DUF6134 family protein [Chitinophaga ginsengisoli]PSL35947.1 hypothetical protein CLV42_101711 [Chitinophaga ginsengisoli]
MKGAIWSTLFICLFTLNSALLYAQTHNYEIRFSNHVIGNVTAHCKVNGASRNISIQSNVDMKLLAKFNLDISCDFDNDILVRSKVIKSSGKDAGDNKTIITQREAKNYSIVQNGKKSVLNTTEIVHSVGEMYFMEPRQVTKIFSETLGIFLTLNSLGNGLYELLLPEGKRNVYKYEKGTLVQVEISQTLGKAYIIRV